MSRREPRMVNGRPLPPPLFVRSGRSCVEIDGQRLLHRFTTFLNESVCVNCQIREELVGKWAVGGPGVMLICETFDQAIGAANDSWFDQLAPDQRTVLRNEHLQRHMADIERQVTGQ